MRSHAADDAPVEDGVEVVRGAKGVDGGAVQVVGEHPAAYDLEYAGADARCVDRMTLARDGGHPG